VFSGLSPEECSGGCRSAPQAVPALSAEHDAGVQLRVAHRQHHVSAGDIATLRQTNLPWFADYRSKLEEVVQIAHTAEPVAS
jgi:hypothetical protein